MSVIELNKNNFEESVIKSDIPVLVDFWASWCGPCKMFSPIVDEIAKAYDGKVKVCKVNIDDQPELAEQFQVMTIPTAIIFNKGAEAERSVGVVPKNTMDQYLAKVL